MNSIYRRFDIIDQCSPFFISPPPYFHDQDLTCATLDLLTPPTFSLLDFHPAPCYDVVQIDTTTPFCAYNRVLRHRFCSPELYLHDRVNSLESKFDRLVGVDRKYTWTAEIKGAVDRKYKLKAEIEGDNVWKGKRGERKYQWTTEIKGKAHNEKKIYSWEATIGGEKKKNGSCSTRMVEIEEPDVDHRILALRQRKAFAKRAQAGKYKGKRKELSPQEAAVMIQMTYRTYLSRRSQTLRDLRELAIARTKLKELRRLFHNYSYRGLIARDAEERQRFSEKIIVLLLTVDAIKGVDHMVKAAKRSMVHELEAMLEWVDPQAGGRSLHTRRRTFDMPSGGIQSEIAEGVARLVELVDQ